MAPERRTIEVWADWVGLDEPERMGFLHSASSRGREVFSFDYDPAWLASGQAPELDPRFGVFLDSSPDRWGRVLMQRREAQLAREEKRAERRLLELDYLLGVYDGHRLGGLRYRFTEGPFLDDDAALASPPWTSLRELEQASLHLESEGAERDPAYRAWLRMLIAPGRSLGGARPKASVVDEDQQLWIAKFPSAKDEDDIAAWESVVHALAQRAGVHVPQARVQKFASRHHTFLSRRFDRTGVARYHFASAMTLLDRRDGEEGASYLELAEIIMRSGAAPAADLEQLWRRIVFFMCVSNIDDHLRNHGFLLRPTGWVLAPAYDMNPVSTGDGLSLNISETDNAQDLALARDAARHFRVGKKRAETIIAEVVHVVRDWRTEAGRAHLSRAEQDRMAQAFRLAAR